MELKPIRTDADHEAALKEIERLWGAVDGAPDGDRLDILITLVNAYEEQRYPIDLPVKQA
jgi:HTH-type transcriptional regulator/antitoxin HigA